MEFNGKKIFLGDIHDGDIYRREYVSSMDALLKRKHDEGYKIRDEFMTPEKLKENPEFFRNEYLKMIGYPFDLEENKIPGVTEEYIGEDDFGKYYRISIEVTAGFKFYGILQKPHGLTKAPLIIAQHGGGGTPEWCSDMAGKNNYNYFTKRALERGFVVFAPSLMLWHFGMNVGESFPEFNIPSDRKSYDVKFRQVGYSMTGLEVFFIRRCLDWLCTLDFIDSTKIGMFGPSYGGYFTMHTTAADTRITSAYSAAVFNDRSYVCFSDWSYENSAHKFHDAEVAGLCAPRHLQIDVGKQDTVFDYRPTEYEATRIAKYFKAYGAEDNFTFNLWDGGHRFDENCKGFEKFFDSLK